MRVLAVLSVSFILVGSIWPTIVHGSLIIPLESAGDGSTILNNLGFPWSNSKAFEQSSSLPGKTNNSEFILSGTSSPIEASLAMNSSLISTFNYTDSPVYKNSRRVHQCDGTARRLPIPPDPTASWSVTLANWDFEGNMVVMQEHRFINLRYMSVVRGRMKIYSASGPDLRIDISFQKSRGDTEGTLDARNIRTGQRFKVPVTIQEGC